jgi:hypothetical protein
MTVYTDTSVGEVRHAMASGEFKVTGDAKQDGGRHDHRRGQ